MCWMYWLVATAPHVAATNAFAHHSDEILISWLPVAGVALAAGWLVWARPGLPGLGFAAYCVTAATYAATSYVIQRFAQPDDSVLSSPFWDGVLSWGCFLSFLLTPVVLVFGEVWWRTCPRGAPRSGHR